MIKPKTIVFDSEKIKYQVQDFLGNGSFGEVYSIKRKDDGKIFALKTIPTPFVDETILGSFINEGKIAIGISHPNVITYYYFHDGSTFSELPLYIIMEYAKGGTLEKKINVHENEKIFFSNAELILMFAQLIAGMKAINSKLIHRDIKPDNILIDDENLKISDFGLSKFVSQATRASTFKGIGCLPFLAPEGWKLEKNTIQMDIYSMGLVFYELATLTFPYTVTRGDFEEWQRVHLTTIPQIPEKINPNISPVISRMIMKMIEKETSRRSKEWSEIEAELIKEEIPKSNSHEIIDKLLKVRNEREQKANQERMEKEKREKEIKEIKQLVLFQLHKDIINPLKEFIDEINRSSSDSKILYNFNEYSFVNSFQFGSNRIEIILGVILEEDFYRYEEIKDYGMIHKRKVLRLPCFNERRIIAWGYLVVSDGRGFNLILVSKNESIYGEWFLLFNRNSAFLQGSNRRPEPFPFNMKEIESEINKIKALHIYVTDVFGLDLYKIKDFTSEYL